MYSSHFWWYRWCGFHYKSRERKSYSGRCHCYSTNLAPLCTAGFGLATLNFKFLAGALYLYSINCFFIGISTFLIIKYMKYSPVTTGNSIFDKKLRIAITILMLLMIIPSSYLAYNLLNEKRFSQNTERFLKDKFYNNGYITLYKKISYNSNPKTIELAFLSKNLTVLKSIHLIRNSRIMGLVTQNLL